MGYNKVTMNDCPPPLQYLMARALVLGFLPGLASVTSLGG